MFNMEKNIKKYIFFDMAGTLLKSRVNWERENSAGAKSVARFLIKKGKKIKNSSAFSEKLLEEGRKQRKIAKEKRIEYRLKDVIKKGLKEFGIAPSKRLISEAEKIYEIPEVKKLSPFPGLRELLLKLKKENYQLILASNTPTREFVKMPLKKYNLLKLFSYIFISCDVGYRKPHKKFLDVLIKKVKPDLSKSVFVGDRLKDDIQSAKDMGIKSIFFNKFSHPDNEKYKNEIIPNIEVKNFRDLYRAIKTIL